MREKPLRGGPTTKRKKPASPAVPLRDSHGRFRTQPTIAGSTGQSKLKPARAKRGPVSASLPVLRDSHGRFLKWLEPRAPIREHGRFVTFVEVPAAIKEEAARIPKPRAFVELPAPRAVEPTAPRPAISAPPSFEKTTTPERDRLQAMAIELARLAEENRAREIELARGRIEQARLEQEIARQEGFQVVEPITHEIRATLDIDTLFDAPVIDQTDRGFDIPDPDYMEALADALDIDISDLYDMYYGYPPGSHGK